MSRPKGKVPLRRPAAASALPAPSLSPLATAKAAWQPTIKWCQKELKQAKAMDPAVLSAVQQFNTLVQAVMAATETDAFMEAQRQAAAFTRKHQFLRWSPLPSPLPTP